MFGIQVVLQACVVKPIVVNRAIDASVSGMDAAAVMITTSFPSGVSAGSMLLNNLAALRNVGESETYATFYDLLT